MKISWYLKQIQESSGELAPLAEEPKLLAMRVRVPYLDPGLGGGML